VNKFYLPIFISLLFFTASSQCVYAINISEHLQVHGFLTQGAFYTTTNNYNGKSKRKVSFDQTEMGLNVSWQASERIDFSAQGLFRRAGDVDDGSIRLDYGLMNVNLFNNQNSQFGMRLGRIKNPAGLYNETRDMAFTTPSILLPQSIYLERSRSLFLSSDGGQIYGNYQIGNGWLSLKANYGKAHNENNEIQKLMFGPIASGELEPENPLFAGQIIYNIESDKYIFAISYADVTLDYKPGLGDIFSSGSAKFAPVIFSAQYNGEKISLTSEYYFSKNIFKNFGPYYPDYSPITTNYYLQATYRLSNKWQTTLRYDVNYLNKDDRSGSQFERVGLPSHMGYTKDWMLGLRWDMTPSIMVRGEYHYINGTSWISAADNPDRIQTEQYWDMFALQLSYRF